MDSSIMKKLFGGHSKPKAAKGTATPSREPIAPEVSYHAVLTKRPNDALNRTANIGCIRVLIRPPRYTSYIRFIVTSKIGRHMCTVKPNLFGERLVKRRDGRWFLRMMKLR